MQKAEKKEENGISPHALLRMRKTEGAYFSAKPSRRRWREKIGVVETAAEFFKKRAGKAKGDGLMKFLRNAPNVPPEAEDEVR